MKALILHYANPGACPPIMRVGRLLRRRGHRVRVIGLARAADLYLSTPKDCADELRLVGGKTHRRGWDLIRFALAIASALIRFRPDVVYVSDPRTCVAFSIFGHLTSAKIIYHEHDAPRAGDVKAQRLARSLVARKAIACITPNEMRSRLLAESAARGRPVLTVWNCPDQADLERLTRHQGEAAARPIRVVYAGSLGAAKTPHALLEALALAPAARLSLIGYETRSARGFSDAFRAKAKALGVGDRVTIEGPLDHAALLLRLPRFHAAFVAFPLDTDDANLLHMAGASNKTFEALAGGLGLIVNTSEAWRTMFVDRGVALACDPSDAHSIAIALNTLAKDAQGLRRMAERGRRLVQTHWRFERQFEKALPYLEAA
ncbi:MAG: glycosyltransferase [Pseudomonadota bacterium]